MGENNTPKLSYEELVRINSDLMSKLSDLQEKLTQSQRITEISLKDNLMGIWEVDLINNIHVWSENYCKLLGYEEVIETPSVDLFYQHIHKDDLELVKSTMQKCLNSKSPCTLEFRFIHKNGKVRHCQSTANYLFNNNGDILRVIGVFKDITEQKFNTKKLIESEKKFKSLFDNVEEGIALHKMIFGENNEPIDFEWVEVNPKYEEITKLNRETLIGKKGKEVIPNIEQSWYDLYAEVTLNGVPQTRIDHSEYLDKYWEVKAFRPEEGHFAVAMTDVTERIKADKKILDEKIRAEQNQMLLEKIAENYPNSYISLIEKDLSVGFTSGQEFIRQSLNPNDFVGLKLDQVFGKDTETIKKKYIETFRGKEQNFEFYHNGQHQLYKTVPLRDEQNEVNRILVVVENITERKVKEIELLAAKEKAEGNEKLYLSFINNLPAGVVVHNRDTSILFNNGLAEELLGLNAKQMQGKMAIDPHWKFVTEDYSTLAVDEYPVMKVIKHKKPLENKIYGVFRKNNDLIWLLVNGFPVLNAENEIEQVIINFIDITKQKGLESRTRILSRAIEQSPVSIIVTNKDGIIEYTNPAFMEITGYASKEVIGNTPAILKSGKHPQEFYQNIWQTLLSGKTWSGEIINKKKDGGYYWASKTISPITDDRNGIVQFISIGEDITEQKHQQQELEKTTKLQMDAQNMAKMGYWTYDIETAVFEAAEVNLEMHDAFQGITFDQLKKRIDPEDLPNFETIFREWIAGDFTNNLNYKVLHSNGTTRYIHASGNALRDKNGKLIGLVGSAQDVTDRKKQELELIEAKNKLEESEKKLRLKLDYLLSPEVSVEDLKLTDLFDLEKLQEIQEAFSIATGVASIITDPDGIPITTASNFSSVCALVRKTQKGTENCRKSDMILGEKALKSQKPILEKCKSCGFIDAAAPINVGGINMGTWLIGQANLGGISKDELADYADEIGGDKEALLEAYSNTNEMDINQFQKICDLLWVYAKELSAFAFNNFNLVKKMEEEKVQKKLLIDAKNKAEEADRLKTAFLSNMSHEIRTPMNGILGFIELLQDPELDKENQQDFMKIIQKSSNRLLNTVNDIVEISKIESGTVKLKKSEVNLVEVLNNHVAFFGPECQKKGLDLIVENKNIGTELIFNSDTSKLDSIYSNLIKNAIKYTNKGQIKVGFECKGDELVFHCEDTGIGIAKDRQNAVFNRFEQADIEDKKAHQGSGLGLSIVKHYVEMLDGKIWVDSKENKGSVFYVSFPSQKRNKPLYQNNEKTQTSAKTLKNLNVLVVEDDEVSTIYLKKITEKMFGQVSFASNGIEAIEKIKNDTSIGLILMDMKMPKMNGYDATMKIRTFNKDVIIIAQTAFAFEENKKRAISAGCNDVLTKPIKKEKFIAVINRFFIENE